MAGRHCNGVQLFHVRYGEDISYRVCQQHLVPACRAQKITMLVTMIEHKT